MHRVLIFIVVWLGPWLVGCTVLGDLINQEEGNVSDAATATPTLVATAVPQSTIEFSQPLTPTVSPTPQPPVLRIWLPPDIALRTDEGASILVSQLEAFNNRYPDLEIIVEQKSAAGQGGILNYLRTGHEVAPGILPDLIALPAELLPEAAAQEVVLPLDGLLTPEMLEARYPAAARMGIINDQLFGYPFALTNLTHLIYNREVITGTVPLGWGEFVTDTQNTVVFPAQGRLSSYLGLQFYLASGGRLFNDAGQPDLQLEPLTEALEQLSMGRTTLAAGVTIDTQDETWQLYQSGAASAAWITSDYYLSLPFVGENNGLSAAPGPRGPLTPLISGWIWLISTPDATERALVAELLAYLVEPQNLGQWSSASNILPARRDALATWTRDKNYRSFMLAQLETAQALPIAQNSRMMEALGNAVQEVLSTSISPQAIAEETIAAFRQ
jgi:ABC-type glycerol-3-phosphate transport system substrate-binding protein